MHPGKDANYGGNLNNASLSGMLCYKQFRVLLPISKRKPSTLF